MDEDLYGTDILMTVDGDLQVTAGGDLAFVTGIANLQQAVNNRVLTLQDEYLFAQGSISTDTSYGSTLKQFVDVTITPELREAIPQDVIASLNNESRLSSTSATVDTSVSGQLTVIISVVSAYGDSFDTTVYP